MTGVGARGGAATPLPSPAVMSTEPGAPSPNECPLVLTFAEDSPDEWLVGLEASRIGSLWHACPVFGSDGAYGGVRDER